MTKGEIAKQNFLSGLNCSQAVALAFKDEIGLTEEQIKKCVIGFGGGFARLRLICGAVSGINFAISSILSNGNDKQKIYSILQDAVLRVKSELGSIICGELLGEKNIPVSPVPENRTEEYYKKRPCAEICEICADIAEKIINENK